MCNETLEILIKNYDTAEQYYRLVIDKAQYDKDNLELYFLINKAFISQLVNECVDTRTLRLLRFQYNFWHANSHDQIMNNKSQILRFDMETGAVHIKPKMAQIIEGYGALFHGIINWFKKHTKHPKGEVHNV